MCTLTIFQAFQVTFLKLVKMFDLVICITLNINYELYKIKHIIVNKDAKFYMNLEDILMLFKIVLFFNSMVKVVELVKYLTMIELNIYQHHLLKFNQAVKTYLIVLNQNELFFFSQIIINSHQNLMYHLFFIFFLAFFKKIFIIIFLNCL